MRFTPKIAGSVMPSHAETPEAEATLRILALCLARNITASAAAPWAQFAQATTTNVGIAFTGSLPATAPLAVIVAGMLVMAVGTGLFQSPNNSLVMGSVAHEHLGFAGSVVSLVRYLGLSVGVTGGTALLYGRMSTEAGFAVDAYIEGRPDLFCSGFFFTFAVFAALCVLGAVLTAAVSRMRKA